MDLNRCLHPNCSHPKKAKNLCNKHYLEMYFSQQPRNTYERGRKRFRRTSLVLELHELLGLPIRTCHKVINAIFDTILDGLRRGEQVKIPGFGIFDTHKKSKHYWGSSTYFRPAKELRYMVRHPSYRSQPK